MIKDHKQRAKFQFSIDVAIRPEDLSDGTARDPEDCLVARQLTRDISRRFRRWKNVRVAVGRNFATLKVDNDSGRETYELVSQINSNTKAFVESVDEYVDVSAGTYGQLTFLYNRTFYNENDVQ